MIKIFSNNKEVPVNKICYTDGAITFKLDELPSDPENITIHVDPITPVKDVREEVGMIMSCLENLYGGDVGYKTFLSLPYLPYARADRVFEKGNPSPLYDFLSWLESQWLKEVYVCDIHNDKFKKYFTNLNIKERSQLQCFKDSLPFDFKKDYDVVVAPDKGAVEKSKTIAEWLDTMCVFADKKRDISTGKLTDMVLPDYDFTDKKVLIPDDICDRAGTHLWLAEKLKDAGACKVDLYVTHAILPEKFKKFKNQIDKIYVYQCIGDYINKQNVWDFNNGRR